MMDQLHGSLATGLAAVLTAVFSGLSAYITRFLSEEARLANFQRVSDRIAQVIPGKWVGQINQTIGGMEGVKFDLSVTFRISGKEIIGDAVANTEDLLGVVSEFRLRGGIAHDRFLQLSYNLATAQILIFGSSTMLLDDGGNRLQGTFSGYGAKSKSPVAGTVVLRKLNAAQIDVESGPRRADDKDAASVGR